MNYLTSLRGIAAFCVVLYHLKYFLHQHDFSNALSFLYNKGYLAVDFFFLLSGFILAYNYAETFSNKLNFSEIQTFIIKRIARIYPLHVFVLALFLLFPLAFLITDRSIDAKQYSLVALFFKILLVDIWIITGEYWNTWNMPSWTISGELFAYLLLPFVLLVFPKKSTGVFILFCVLVLSIAIMYDFFGFVSLGEGISTLGLFRCVVTFYCGVCLHVFFVKFKDKISNRGAVSLLVFACTSCVVLGFNFTANHFFVPSLFALMLFAFLCSKTPLHTLLNHKGMVYFGEISYSLYLNHIFVIAFYKMLFLADASYASVFDLTAIIVSCIVMSHFTYQYIERPMRRYTVKRWSSRSVNA
ncbi:acyltransferase family protein [Agaribacter marinus]|uniref:Acyltransferase n=1 Tax=Agaribacter marinus TaxID=1431249 RepID=A0AA37SYI6_9ALTE|nr:acyltransferase [Agaribacter marinus]GLR70934.1 acyltransferase [Agaribacter marinus]